MSWEQSSFLLVLRSEFTGKWSKFKNRQGSLKGGESNIKGGAFFFSFYQSKLLSHFVPVSPDTYTKREISRIKFNGCLVDLNTMT